MARLVMARLVRESPTSLVHAMLAPADHHWAPRIQGLGSEQSPGRGTVPRAESPSPEVRVPAQLHGPRPVFVLHEHHKPQHHFDLRLEEDGVLRSWAVPRGLPTTAAKDRLAVPVDDHALDHATYEDETKSIADTGWWELEDRNERRTVFVLHGRGRPRRYALVSTDRGALLHLVKDQPRG